MCSWINADKRHWNALNATGWTCLGSRNCSPISQAFAMQTPTIATPPAHRCRATKLLQPPNNPDESSAAGEGSRETEAFKALDTFHSNCSTSFLNGLGGAHRSRILLHELGTRLLVAGCLLLGAGFLIKLDTTGPCGKFLSSGMKGCWVLSREHCHGVW